MRPRSHARERQLELPVDHVVREVGGEPHLRDRVQQRQGGEEVVGDAVPVRLEMHRHPDPVRHLDPRPDDRDGAFDGERKDLADDVDVGRAEILRHEQRVAQALDRLRERDDQRGQSLALQMRPDLVRGRHVRRPEVDGEAVVARLRHHPRHPVVGQPLARLVVRLHRPERLEDPETLHAASTRREPPPVRGTIQTSS